MKLPHRWLFFVALAVSQVVVVNAAWTHQPRIVFAGIFATLFSFIGLAAVDRALEIRARLKGYEEGRRDRLHRAREEHSVKPLRLL